MYILIIQIMNVSLMEKNSLLRHGDLLRIAKA